MASAADFAQVQFEESPRYEGAPTTTPYRLSSGNVKYIPSQTIRVNAVPAHLDRSDELRGIQGGVPQLIETYEPDGAVSMRAYPNIIPWFLQCAGFTATITQGDGSTVKDPNNVAIPTGAYRYVFNKRTGITAKTMQIQLGYLDEGEFLKGQGYAVSGATLNADGIFTADLMGLVLARIADPSLTPVYDSQTVWPFRRGDLTLTWLASTGTTSDFSLAVANDLVRRRTLGLTPSSLFSDKLELGDAQTRVTGTIPKSVFAAADWDALISATAFSATAQWKSAILIGATTYPYSMWWQMPSCQYLAGTPDDLAPVRRMGASFDFWAAYDETAAYDVKITIVNAVSSAAFETLV